MSIIALLVTLAIAGFVIYLILQIPMPQVFRNVILGVVCLVLVLWVLQQLGLYNTGLRLR
jgi:uncharacterized membrane protein YeaQ/YmgE (transglycosylase-associated protein family)